MSIPDHVESSATEVAEPEVEIPKSDDDEEVHLQGKEIVLNLFKAATRLGARKNLSFHTAKADNFTVELSFENPEQLPPSTPSQISFYTITGVEKTRAHNYTGKPKISLGFRLTTSGLIELEKAEAEITVVKWPEPEPEDQEEKEQTEGGEAKEAEKAEEEKAEEKAEEKTEEKAEEKTEEKSDEKADDDKKEKKEAKEEKKKAKKEKKKEGTQEICAQDYSASARREIGYPRIQRRSCRQGQESHGRLGQC